MTRTVISPIRKGYLKKYYQEKFNRKRGWFVKAWRILDEHGNDIVQPWFDTKAEAMEYAKTNNIWILPNLR